MSTPSYYPPGWDRERWQSATEEDFATLTDEQFETFHAGIRADLGEDGTEKFFEEMDRKQDELKNTTTSAPTLAPSERPPNFISYLENARDEDGGFAEWGFVVFRTAGYGSDDVASGVKAKIEAHVVSQFDAVGSSTDVQNAREKFRLMWIESEDLNGATPEEVARHYEAANVPIWLRHSLCLCLDGSSINSIQNEDSGKAPAHLLVVSITCGGEFSGDEADDERWTGSFKVAVKTLVTELFAETADGALSPYEIGVGITPDLVRTGAGRFGMQKAYADEDVSPLQWEGRLRKR